MWETLGTVTAKAGPWGIAIGVILTVLYALMRGELIPRSTHEDRVSDLKAAITALEATVREREAQIATLLGRAREPVE